MATLSQDQCDLRGYRGGGTNSSRNGNHDRSRISLYHTDIGGRRWNQHGNGFVERFDRKPHLLYSYRHWTTVGPAADLVSVSGNNQTGSAGQPLANPFVVKVTDAKGNLVSGATVTFAVTAGGGVLSPAIATTNTQGLASTTLTLGSNAGVNTVSASSGALTGSPLTFNATGTTSSQAQGTVTWTKQSAPAGLPGFLGYLTLPYDPVSNQTMLWSNDGGIYSSHMRFYNSAANAFTAIAGSGSNQDSCPPDLPNMPGDRHPDGQLAIDSKRNFLWAFGGAIQTCGLGYVNVSGTSVSLNLTQYTNWTFPTGGQIVGQTMAFSGAGNAKIASVQDATHLTLGVQPRHPHQHVVLSHHRDGIQPAPGHVLPVA